jgi:hypothetical protein
MDMMLRKLSGWTLAALAATSLAGQTALADDAKPSHRWRIEVSEGANSDGTIRFVVTPAGGDVTTVEVPIKKGRHENDVAKDVRDAFIRTLPAGQYHVEVDDGEDIIVSNKEPYAAFSVAMVDSTVKSVRVEVERH